jgi:hypothetical protein
MLVKNLEGGAHKVENNEGEWRDEGAEAQIFFAPACCSCPFWLVVQRNKIWSK